MIIIATTHRFVPISVETGGPLDPVSSEFIAELDNRISEITLEPLETISFPKVVHIAAERKRTGIQIHVLSRVFFARECAIPYNT